MMVARRLPVTAAADLQRRVWILNPADGRPAANTNAHAGDGESTAAAISTNDPAPKEGNK